jgi:hypothetical protein
MVGIDRLKLHLEAGPFTAALSAACGHPLNSNGKSSIVEEQLYTFFFAFFPKKNRSFIFSFFLFFTITNEDVRFALIL